MRDQAATDKLIAEARERLVEMRQAESQAGCLSPEDETGYFSLAATALLALECALHLEDWEVAAESYVMLETVLKRVLQIAAEVQLTPTTSAH